MTEEQRKKLFKGNYGVTVRVPKISPYAVLEPDGKVRHPLNPTERIDVPPEKILVTLPE